KKPVTNKMSSNFNVINGLVKHNVPPSKQRFRFVNDLNPKIFLSIRNPSPIVLRPYQNLLRVRSESLHPATELRGADVEGFRNDNVQRIESTDPIGFPL